MGVVELQHEAGLVRDVVAALLLGGGDTSEDRNAVTYALDVAAAASRCGAAAGPQGSGEDEDEVEEGQFGGAIVGAQGGEADKMEVVDGELKNPAAEGGLGPEELGKVVVAGPEQREASIVAGRRPRTANGRIAKG